MGKTLIIAEKPSVMNDLAKALNKALGKFEKKGTGRDIHYENDDAIITSAVGHLVELRGDGGGAERGRNSRGNSTCSRRLPDSITSISLKQSEAKLKKKPELPTRMSIKSSMPASCPPGGQPIFRYIMEIGNIDKPVKRLWMQSMTTGAIISAWGKPPLR